MLCFALLPRDIANFNLTFAAYLIGVGQGAYFGAGSQWAQCDDWLIPHWEYQEALGAPDGPGTKKGTQWTRSFAAGATTVVLDTGGAQSACAPDTAGVWTIDGTQQYFTLVSSNA